MVKVILDFQSLPDTEEAGSHLQKLVDCAKEITGFALFARFKGDDGAQLLCCISPVDLAMMIVNVEEKHPEIKMIRLMTEAMKGGGMNGRRGMFGI